MPQPVQSPGGSSTASSRDASPSREISPLVNSLKPPTIIRRGPQGFGFTIRAIRVYFGDSDYYTVHHLVMVSWSVIVCFVFLFLFTNGRLFYLYINLSWLYFLYMNDWGFVLYNVYVQVILNAFTFYSVWINTLVKNYFLIWTLLFTGCWPA